MVIRGYEIGAKLILYVVAALLLIGGVAFGVRSCDSRHSRGAQTRLDASQSAAQANSAADAVTTVSRSGEAAAASEALTRSNEQQIRAAEGAGQKVGAGVNAAGRSALCRRAAYANDPKCKGVKP